METVEIDLDLLNRFERGLDPWDLSASPVPARLLGYGEISAIFEIEGLPGLALKRLPLFADRARAEAYAADFDQYGALLIRAGLHLPASRAVVADRIPGRPMSLYIAQARQPADRLGQALIHTLPRAEIEALIRAVAGEIDRVWRFNQDQAPETEVAIDGQISNWVLTPEGRLLYLDTSTPLFRRNGRERLDPELLLQTAPGFLRWLLRWLFVDDVMNRYYDPRQVFTDLAANLIKEQRPELVPLAVAAINDGLGGDVEPLTVEAVQKYYRHDRLIWSVFLTLRRLDRWLVTRVFRRRYEFILPGKIKR